MMGAGSVVGADRGLKPPAWPMIGASVAAARAIVAAMKFGCACAGSKSSSWITPRAKEFCGARASSAGSPVVNACADDVFNPAVARVCSFPLWQEINCMARPLEHHFVLLLLG